MRRIQNVLNSDFMKSAFREQFSHCFNDDSLGVHTRLHVYKKTILYYFIHDTIFVPFFQQ